MHRILKTWMPAAAALLLLPAVALAEDAPTVSPGEFFANNVWMMLATALVFIMHLGFAALETSLCQSKNSVNILFKNTMMPCVGLLVYFLVGFGLMYPGEFNGYFGFAGFGVNLPENGLTTDYASGGYTYWTDFLFQGMFAATCTTIISGAVAERIKLKSFMFFATIFCALVYTVGGSWKWGGGFLDQMGFYDFAGSTVVHSMGGWAALVGAWMLGPRMGKYGKDGRVNPIPGSNMPLAVTGVVLLWLGWFGFNGGSVLSADPGATSFVLVTTSLAAAAGAVGSVAAYMFVSSKPDLSMTLNGILAGLVGITAGADVISPMNSILVGFVAGMIVVFAVMGFDKIKIDDPVGATSVHLVCGIWGTLAVGIFSTNPEHNFMTQLIGVGVYAAYALVTSFALFSLTKVLMGLRVSAEEEMGGLDQGEHGMHAYDMNSGAHKGAALETAGAAQAAFATEAAPV